MIKIQNIYYMLAYAYQSLSITTNSKVGIEAFEYADDLFANILSKGLARQIKMGLCNDYVSETEELLSPKGKIILSETIRNQVRQKKEVICRLDNYIENTYLNQILKTTAILLLRSPNVSKENRQALKKVLLYFTNVEEINPYRVEWKRLTYNRNNVSYRMLINLCYLIIEGMLMTDDEGNLRLNQFIDDQRMSALYERFILMYYKKHYPHYKVSRSQIPWDSDDGIIDLLPRMKSDIMLEYKGKTLIIDAKYYGESLQTNTMYGNKTVHSNNLYQIYAYVKNKDIDKQGTVSGMLLYARTDGENPDNEYRLAGNKISVKTLDLQCDFAFICSQLDSIAEKWEIE